MQPPPSSAAHALGQRVRQLRKARGFSQDRFAMAAQIDRSYMGQIERGEKNVTLTTLLKISAALQIDVGELVAGIRDPSQAE